MTGELLTYIAIFAVSLFALLQASDFFVAAAEKIGLSFGIPPFIIGVTVVAFGTSLPELASSIAAVVEGSSDIVIGNVVGSNVANVALVIFLLNSLTGNKDDEAERPKITWQTIVILIASAVVIKFGADYTVLGIVKLSGLMGIGSAVIAQSLVALGTSLPEVFVSIAAIKKGQTDIAVGNVLGSNIFNTYAVMSIPAFIGPLVIPPEVLQFSLPFMVALTIALAVMCISKTISRWEGYMLMLFYVFFLVKLFV